jgi:crotonobetainyl-CoA:carnitine CoA-transferase CaiB-like acyl-CoA transferase
MHFLASDFMSTLFNGIKILDLSTVLAGPSVATFFAELGATVTKIENPRTSGDVTRSWKLPGENPNATVSAYFSAVNYKKSYLYLNLGDTSSREQLEQLIKEADVVIVNFKHGDDLRFRLTPQDIQSLKNDIIYARITGFSGQPGRVAYDVVLQAETGYMYMNGTDQSGPVKMPVAMVDVLAAHQLKEGILCALIKRLQTGKGSVVSCSLEKAGLSALVNQASNYLMTGHVPVRLGSLHPNIAPYGETFVCANGKALVLAVGSDKQFQNLCEILGAPEVSKQPLYIDNHQRVKHRQQLAQALSPLFAQFDSEELLAKLIEKNVPAGAIRSMDEVMKNPVAQAMILEEEIEGIMTQRMQSAAFTIEDLSL